MAAAAAVPSLMDESSRRQLGVAAARDRRAEEAARGSKKEEREGGGARCFIANSKTTTTTTTSQTTTQSKVRRTTTKQQVGACEGEFKKETTKEIIEAKSVDVLKQHVLTKPIEFVDEQVGAQKLAKKLANEINDKLAIANNKTNQTGELEFEDKSGTTKNKSETATNTTNTDNNNLTNQKKLPSFKEQLKSSTTTAPSNRLLSTQKKGLLETLLGERGRSWFEQKNVILDIQNGQKGNKKQQAGEKTTKKVVDKKELSGGDQNNSAQDKANHEPSKEEYQIRSFNIFEDNNEEEVDEEIESNPKRQTSVIQKLITTNNTNGLPTFGAIPQKLSRLPYFSYHGQAKNIDITKASDRAQFLLDSANKNNQVDKYKPLARSYVSSASSGSGSSSSHVSLVAANNSVRVANNTHLSNYSSSLLSSSSSSSGSLTSGARILSPRSPPPPSSSLKQRLASKQKKRHSGSEHDNLTQRINSIGRRLSGAQEQQQRHYQIDSNRAKPDRRRSLGFSNISNLFPGEPVRHHSTRQTTTPASRQSRQLSNTRLLTTNNYQKHKSTSLVNLNTTQKQPARVSKLTSMRRPVHHASGGQSHLRGALGSTTPGRAGGGRPASAQGNYLHHYQRSPSSSSLYQHQYPASHYRLGSAGMSPLIDPDCPVHGDSPPPPQQMATNKQRGYNEHALFDYNQTMRPHQSSSQPDLLYGVDGGGDTVHRHELSYAADDPYNSMRYTTDATRRSNNKQSPIYSPLSPTNDHHYELGVSRRHNATRYNSASNGNLNGTDGSASHHDSAYYNSAGKFSMYHATGGGGGDGLSPVVRSSLAPTSEQLRRILGYRPAQVLSRKPVHLHPQWAYTRPFIHLQPAGSGFGTSRPSVLLDADNTQYLSDGDLDDASPQFVPFNRLQDNQAIRAVDFHPSGQVYAIGSNSRALRICAYPAEHELRHFNPALHTDQQQQHLLTSSTGAQSPLMSPPAPPHVKSPRVLFKFLQVHRGSIYCVSFSPSGRLLATGSNDQTVHVVKYNSITHNPDGDEYRLTMHNGTIRDLCFIDDSSGNGSSLLLSAGGGDNKIYVTDCDTITPFQSMAGHTQMVMALNHCGGAQFVSGSYDKTIRFWDLRTRACTSIVSAPPSGSSPSSPTHHQHQTSGQTFTTTTGGGGPGAPVCALRVDPSGRLLVSGHTDSTCMLYDIRGGKIIQTFRPHEDEIRAISFSPKSYYLLTGGYDGRLVVSDLQGDLTQPLPSVCVAESQDKIVQAKWHPADFTFVSTSADKSATLWSLPGDINN